MVIAPILPQPINQCEYTCEVGMNICNHCGEQKPWTEFYKSTRTTSGYRNTCISCCASAASKRYKSKKTFCGHNQSNIPMPSRERLNSLFEYMPDGTLKRKLSAGSRKCGTVEKGKREKSGYFRICVDSNHYLLHRIIWKLHYGDDPLFIDHVDGDRANSRIENLRAVNKSSNSQHQLLPKNNTSGYFGVSLYPYYSNDKWVAKIANKAKPITIGYYPTAEHAAVAYCKKCVELHGEFGKRKVIHNINTMIERGFNPKDYGWG